MNINKLTLFIVVLFCCNSISAAATRVVENQIDKNEWHFYQFDTDTISELTIKLRKISDDVDLYVSRAKKPTENDFLCAPKRSSQLIETCRLSLQSPGKWYIGIHGKASSDYQLGIKVDDCDLISLRDVQ